jgi:hypothetical protein
MKPTKQKCHPTHDSGTGSEGSHSEAGGFFEYNTHHKGKHATSNEEGEFVLFRLQGRVQNAQQNDSQLGFNKCV